MTATTVLRRTAEAPMLLAEVEVVSVERPSPAYARVELGSPVLADLGVDGPLRDQRVKLIFPTAAGRLALPRHDGPAWFSQWVARPTEERGHMRTYTAREVRGHGVGTRLVVDFVLHPDDGAVGPGASWAAAARPGDRVGLIGPRRGVPFGGIEFQPGGARDLLLVGDETAVPAVASILSGLPYDARGAAYLEVPHGADVQRLNHPAGVEVTWLPREGASRGALLTRAVVGHLGGGTDDLIAGLADDEVDPELWETPDRPGGDTTRASRVGPAGLYAWIAGEAKVVTGLRRHLVRDVGLDRAQVAFMGYWREGVAMRS